MKKKKETCWYFIIHGFLPRSFLCKREGKNIYKKIVLLYVTIFVYFKTTRYVLFIRILFSIVRQNIYERWGLLELQKVSSLFFLYTTAVVAFNHK